MINDKSYIHIWWRMLNELHLKWSELIIYATIFSFTNWTEDHCFHWSAEYLWKRTWISRSNVMKNLKKLENKELIFRKEKMINWVKFVDYYTTGCPKIEQEVWKNRTSYNSIYNSNKDIDKSISFKKEKINKKEKKEYWEFKHIKLTEEEYEKIRKLVWWWINKLIEECDTRLELHPKKKYTNFYAFLKNRVQKNQKWKQNELEIKQQLYNTNKSKYKNTYNNKNIDIESAKQKNQEKIQQQFLSNNYNNNERDQDWAINRRREIWGNWIFQELE